MGKVQDILNNISHLKRPIHRLADQLQTPAQSNIGQSTTVHSNTGSRLPVEIDAIQSWLIAHSAFNSTTSVTTLIQVLEQNNRIPHTPPERLQIMQLFKQPVEHALQMLGTRYLYLDLPLADDAEESFRQSVTLYQEMANGFKIALADSINGRQKGMHRSRLKSSQKQQVIRQCFEHLNHCALRHAQVYRNWPASLWSDANTLFRIAKIERLANKLPDTTQTTERNSNNIATIENSYAQLCALHLFNNKQWTAEKLQQLYQHIVKHAALLTFSFHKKNATGNSLNENNQYCIGPDHVPVKTEAYQQSRQQQRQQSSQQHGQQIGHNKLICFSITELAHRITTESHISESNHESYIDFTLPDLAIAESNDQRTHTRTPADCEIPAVTGLKEIHACMQIQPPNEQVESQFTNVKQLLSVPDLSASKPNETRPNETRNSKTLNSVGTDYGASFLVENESKHGYGLAWTGSGNCKMQIGELIANCYTNNTGNEISWQVSVIRWLQSGPGHTPGHTKDGEKEADYIEADNTLRCGTELISRHTKPVMIHKLLKGDGQSRPPMEGLLANYQPIDCKARMLLLPLKLFKPGETVGYRDDLGFHLAKLTERVYLNGGFQCFAIKMMSSELDYLAADETQAAIS